MIKPLIIYQMDPLGHKIGGIQTFVKNFIKYAPDDFDIHFVGVASKASAATVGTWQEVEVFGKKVQFFPVLYKADENVRSRVPLSLKFTLALMRYRRRISPEGKIIEYHRIEPEIPFFMAPNKKFLVIHGNVTDIYNPHTEVTWGRFPGFYFAFEKRLIHGMDKIFVVRQDGVDYYRAQYPQIAERFTFLPTWVDQDLFHPLRPSERKTRKEEFLKKQYKALDSKLIVFVGRLEGQKDPLLLIETFKRAVVHIPDACLLIVGQGALRKKMEELIREYALEGKVVFFNSLPQDKVAGIMQISDIFLMTSAFEGMPRSVMESLGCGLPVVTTEVGEVRLVVRDGFSGIVCKGHDAGSLAQSVVNVCRNHEIYSADNCVRSIENYTAPRILQHVYQTYYDLEASR